MVYLWQLCLKQYIQLNMEVVTVDATFITAILVISFMYQWFKENNNK